MNRKFKILLGVLFGLVTLLFIGWKTFNYFWRTKQTVHTFSFFSEPKDIAYSTMFWVTDTVAGVVSDKAAFLVKVKLNQIDYPFYMQFDTGTPQTVFYAKTLNSLKNRFPELSIENNDQGKTIIKNTTLSLGNMQFRAEAIRSLRDRGSSNVEDSLTIIGTIGYDIILERKLILNFKNNTLSITNKEAEKTGIQFNFVKGASVDRFPLLVPAQIGKYKGPLWFDTGSSTFPLLVSKDKFFELSGSSEVDTLCCAYHWGEKHNVYKSKLQKDIKIGKISSKGQNVYYSRTMDNISYFPNWMMLGMTGNVLFDDKIIFIDTKNNIFGISE